MKWRCLCLSVYNIHVLELILIYDPARRLSTAELVIRAGAGEITAIRAIRPAREPTRDALGIGSRYHQRMRGCLNIGRTLMLVSRWNKTSPKIINKLFRVTVRAQAYQTAPPQPSDVSAAVM